MISPIQGQRRENEHFVEQLHFVDNKHALIRQRKLACKVDEDGMGHLKECWKSLISLRYIPR